MFRFDKLVCFGNNLNDRRCSRVPTNVTRSATAHESVKQLATGIIDSNNNDGVAKFLEVW
ncbi:HAD hydrolase family protein [Paenibacillus solanacearum]|uniref:HAD hydrolase family protein n=1 Tax=Paenibacillus solanacearum TaxID=2048548 RepID=UPI001C403356